MPTYLSFLISSQAQQQQTSDYYNLVEQAKKMRVSGDLVKAGELYSKAFHTIKIVFFNVSDVLDAASVYVLLRQKDSAFHYLKLVVNEKYPSTEKKLDETQYNFLKQFPEWKVIENFYSNQQIKKKQKFNDSLSTALEGVYDNDQKVRLTYDSLFKHKGSNAAISESIEEMKRVDSADLLLIRSVLTKNGWPTQYQVSHKALKAIFIVLQHSDIKTMKKFYPLLKKAVKGGNAEPDDYALMTDRIQTRQNKKQLFGTQLRYSDAIKKYELFPVYEPMNLNKRRAAYGLKSIDAYLTHFQ